jgi:hypothetical protein
MRRSRYAQAGLIVLLVAGCGTTATPAPTGANPTPTASPSGSPSVSSPPIATASPISSSGPSSGPSAVADGWQRAPDNPTLDAVQLSLVTWTGQRFVAAGMADDGSTRILDSTDGQTWNLQPGLGPNVEIHGFGAGPAGIVAVGAQGSSARSWLSPDGLSWSAGPTGSALAPAKGNTLEMDAVTPSESGWLAVGTEYSACLNNCNGSAAVRAAAWQSSDGRTWTREPQSTSLSSASMASVIQGGPGYVAVGSAPNRPGGPLGPVHGVVWTSIDGRAWARVADTTTFHPPLGADQAFGALMTGIAVAGGHLVAVGTVESQDNGSALAWVSSDGLSWARGTSDSFASGQLFHVAVVPGGFLATGPSGSDSCLGGTWSSTDGASWSCIAIDPAFTNFAAYAAAASPTLEVVVGFDSTNGTGSIVWSRPLP